MSHETPSPSRGGGLQRTPPEFDFDLDWAPATCDNPTKVATEWPPWLSPTAACGAPRSSPTAAAAPRPWKHRLLQRVLVHVGRLCHFRLCLSLLRLVLVRVGRHRHHGSVRLGHHQTKKQNYNSSFGSFRLLSGQTWSRDPLQRVKLGKWCRTRPNLAPETNDKAIS